MKVEGPHTRAHAHMPHAHHTAHAHTRTRRSSRSSRVSTEREGAQSVAAGGGDQHMSRVMDSGILWWGGGLLYVPLYVPLLPPAVHPTTTPNLRLTHKQIKRTVRRGTVASTTTTCTLRSQLCCPETTAELWSAPRPATWPPRQHAGHAVQPLQQWQPRPKRSEERRRRRWWSRTRPCPRSRRAHTARPSRAARSTSSGT